MKFELNHDWQGNMSSPRSTLGDKTKIHLFLMLAIIWILLVLLAILLGFLQNQKM
jgi:hypothetical protein